jgi:hypothetical protein
MTLDELLVPGEPWLHLAVEDKSDLADAVTQVARRHPDAVVRIIRGAKSRTTAAFFDEVGAALQFPYYFGDNWAAFDECITDMDWLPGHGYLLVVNDAQLLFSDEQDDPIDTLVEILKGAAEAWQGSGGDDAVAFKVLLQTASAADDEALRSRLG